MEYIIREEAITKEDDDGNIIVVNILSENDCYYKISGVAKDAWNMFSASKTYDQVLAQIVNDYDVDEGQAREDIDKFLKKLKAMDLVISNGT